MTALVPRAATGHAGVGNSPSGDWPRLARDVILADHV